MARTLLALTAVLLAGTAMMEKPHQVDLDRGLSLWMRASKDGALDHLIAAHVSAHEAGHAIAGMAMGAEVDFVTRVPHRIADCGFKLLAGLGVTDRAIYEQVLERARHSGGATCFAPSTSADPFALAVREYAAVVISERAIQSSFPDADPDLVGFVRSNHALDTETAEARARVPAERWPDVEAKVAEILQQHREVIMVLSEYLVLRHHVLGGEAHAIFDLAEFPDTSGLQQVQRLRKERGVERLVPQWW